GPPQVHHERTQHRIGEELRAVEVDEHRRVTEPRHRPARDAFHGGIQEQAGQEGDTGPAPYIRCVIETERSRMSSFTLEDTEVRREAGSYWWLFLLTGILWL